MDETETGQLGARRRKPLPERLKLGSLREVAEQLNLGHDIAKLKRAFHQNASAYIVAKFKYKANDGTERSLEAGFTRYSVVFTGEKFQDGSIADAVYVTLNPDYREVLNNAPMRPLDLGYKKQLPPAAQRFYEIVSYKIFAALKYNQPFARLAYSEYCTFSAQQRYYDYDHFKKQMYKVHRPHVTSGYLARTAHYEEATDGEGQRDWLMLYTPGPKARAEVLTAAGRAGTGAPNGRRTPLKAKKIPEHQVTVATPPTIKAGHPQLDEGALATNKRGPIADA